MENVPAIAVPARPRLPLPFPRSGETPLRPRRVKGRARRAARRLPRSPGAAGSGAAGDRAQENVKITAAPRPPAARPLLRAPLPSPSPPSPAAVAAAASRTFLPADGEGSGPLEAVNPTLSVLPLSVLPWYFSPLAPPGSVAPRQPPPPLRFSGCRTGGSEQMRAVSMRAGAAPACAPARLPSGRQDRGRPPGRLSMPSLAPRPRPGFGAAVF